MPKPTGAGPKLDKLPIERLPVDKLADVLPEGSGLGEVVAPPPLVHTGLTGGYLPATGVEPYLYDATTFRIMADFTAGSESTFVSSVAPLNGDLYLGAQSTDPYDWSAALFRWDKETGTVTNVLPEHLRDNGLVNYLRVSNDDIYFSYFDLQVGNSSFGVLDGATDSVSFVTLPSYAGSLSTLRINSIEEHGGRLYLQITNSNGKDVLVYDPVQQTWNGYDLPDAGYSQTDGTAFFVGGGYYFYGTANYVTSLYRMDLATGQMSVAFANASGYYQVNEGLSFTGPISDGGDIYLLSYVFDGILYSQGILKVDSASGDVSLVRSVPGMTYIGIASANGTTAYIELDWQGQAWDLILFSEDSSGATVVEHYDLDYQRIGIGGILDDGFLYFSATNDGIDSDLFRLELSSDTISFVAELGTGYIQPLSYIDGSLVAAADTDGDGFSEVWTSSTPDVSSSWTKISGDVSYVANYFSTVLEGDYLL